MMLPKKPQEMETDYNRFIEAWGTNSQVLKSIGEMSELIEVLTRELLTIEFSPLKFYQEPSFEELLSEIADAYLMIDQLSFMFGRARIKEIIAKKLERALQGVEAFEESIKK